MRTVRTLGAFSLTVALIRKYSKDGAKHDNNKKIVAHLERRDVAMFTKVKLLKAISLNRLFCNLVRHRNNEGF